MYVIAGLIGAFTIGVVMVVGVLIGRAWDAITGDEICEHVKEWKDNHG